MPKTKQAGLGRIAPGRSAIARAARRLFAKRGYAATTIEAIAEAAGYAVPTVYFHFGSKAAIVGYLLDEIREQTIIPTFKASLESDDPRRVLELTARIARSSLDESWDLYSVIRSAARSDRALAKLHAGEESGRLFAMQQTAGWLLRGGHLAKGTDVERATAVLWALASQDTYERLVIERGWTPGAYESWLGDCLKRELLGTATIVEETHQGGASRRRTGH